MVITSSTSAFAAKSSPPFQSNSSSFGGFPSTSISWGSGFTASFCNRTRGSAVQSYCVTKEIDSNGRNGIGKIHSISAMPIYESKSHEELRFEDYELKQGSTFSIKKPENTFQQSNTSTFSFNSTPAVVRSGSANGSTNSIFGVYNVQPFSGFSSGLSSSSTFSFNSSTCAFQAPMTRGFGIKPTPSLWSTSTSVVPSISGFSGGQGTIKVGHSIGNQHKGSGLASYSAVNGEFGGDKIQSISAMPIYKEKSHEELRLEDYELRTKLSNNSSANSQAFVTTNNNNSTIFKSSTLSPPLNPFFPTNSSPLSSCITEPRSNNNPANISFHVPPPSNHSSAGSHALVTNSSTSSIPSSAVSPSTGFWPSFLKPSQPGQTADEKTKPHSTTNSLSQPLSSARFSFHDPPLSNHSSADSQALVTNSISPFSSYIPSSAISPSISSWPSFLKSSPPEKPEPNSTTNIPSTQPSPQASNISTLLAEVANQNINAQQQYVPSITDGLQSVNRLGIGYAPIQHGTSSIQQVSRKIPSLSIRHVSSRHNKLPDRGHSRGRSSEPKVPVLSNEEYRPFPIDPFLPRENPRACFINSHRIFQGATTSGGSASDARLVAGKGCEDKACPSASFKLNVDEEDENDSALEKLEADVLALMPKLRAADYYMEPSIKDLAAKEMAEPGFCSRVNDFVVGRKNYGSIKFLGETDIRHLDIGSVIRFNNREVIVYPDDAKKPPLGQSLNKPAEITLLNVKCISKKTGKEYIDGVEVESYKEMLMKKASKHGAEFVSYDPVRGEWKFRVEHF